MEVLFVCNGNVIRSQTAVEYYNQFRPGQASSAGIIVNHPGERLKDKPSAMPIITALSEDGIDVSNNRRTLLTEDLVKQCGKIVIMADEENVPAYVRNYPDVEYWQIQDTKEDPIDNARAIRDEIKTRVGDLVERIDPRS